MLRRPEEHCPRFHSSSFTFPYCPVTTASWFPRMPMSRSQYSPCPSEVPVVIRFAPKTSSPGTGGNASTWPPPTAAVPETAEVGHRVALGFLVPDMALGHVHLQCLTDLHPRHPSPRTPRHRHSTRPGGPRNRSTSCRRNDRSRCGGPLIYSGAVSGIGVSRRRRSRDRSSPCQTQEVGERQSVLARCVEAVPDRLHPRHGRVVPLELGEYLVGSGGILPSSSCTCAPVCASTVRQGPLCPSALNSP